MPKFPTRQADIKAMAYSIAMGAQNHNVDFPNIDVFEIVGAINLYVFTRNAQNQARAAAKLATEAKNASLKVLVQSMKKCLKKSEVDAAVNPEKLALIGWRPKTASQDITMPGQPQNLRIINGENKLLLKWDRPIGGGTVRYYIIEKREVKPDSVWTLVATSYDTQKSLSHQPHGAQIEYRVKAVKTAGESIPGNIVSISL